jgi:hypothetical protein
MKLYLAVIATAALGVVAPSMAAAQSPAAYRAQLNRHCRTFTPKFKRLEAGIKKAVSTAPLLLRRRTMMRRAFLQAVVGVTFCLCCALALWATGAGAHRRFRLGN